MRLAEILLEKSEEGTELMYTYSEYQPSIVFTIDLPMRTTIESGQLILITTLKFSVSSETPYLVIDMPADAEREIGYSRSFVKRTVPEKVEEKDKIYAQYLEISLDDFFFLF